MATNENLLDLYANVRRKLSVFANSLLKDTGLGFRQYIILKAIAQEGEMKVSTLVDYCMTDPGTVSRSVAQLQEAGLLDKHQSKEDGRVWNVSLTKKGQTYVPKVNKVYSELSHRCFSKLKPQEKKTLAALLERVSKDLTQE
jgi:DNA-binding MarR family transcriptional regulator